MAMGEFARVEEHLHDALDRTGVQVADWEILTLMVDAAAMRRDLAALDKYTEAAEEASSRFNQKLHLGIVYRAKGVAHWLRGDVSKSEERLNLALNLFQELGARWQEGLTLIEMGELAAQEQEYVIAHDTWLRALNNFETMGAVPDVTRTQHKLDSLTQ